MRFRSLACGGAVAQRLRGCVVLPTTMLEHFPPKPLRGLSPPQRGAGRRGGTIRG